MKVLLVEPFGKTSGEDTLSYAKCMSNEVEIEVYTSDDFEPQGDFKFKIVKGFRNVYSGNPISKMIKYYKALREMKKYIKNNKFDIVHLNRFSLPWIEWIYVRQIKRYAKIVITIHDVIPFNCRPLEMRCLNSIYKTADRILLHTETCMKQYKQFFSTRTELSIISQGFRNKRDYTVVPKDEARKQLGISEKKKVILFFGIIRESKGADILLKAFEIAVKKNPELFLVLVGGLQKVSSEYYNELADKDLVKNNSIVRYEYIPAEMEKVYFSAADVLCLPYREIYQSGVAQLGLVYELPMIATDVGEMKEVVINGVNGLIVNKENVDELADAILKIFSSKNNLQDMSNKSKELGLNEFSLDIKANKTIEAYNKL